VSVAPCSVASRRAAFFACKRHWGRGNPPLVPASFEQQAMTHPQPSAAPQGCERLLRRVDQGLVFAGDDITSDLVPTAINRMLRSMILRPVPHHARFSFFTSRVYV